MFAIFIGVFEFLVPIELNAGRNDRFFQWLVRIVFAGLFFITAYGVADTAIRKLRVTSEGIESRTFLSTRLIHWCEIKRVNWCSIGGIRIESEQTHITIDPHSRPNELRWLLAVSIKRQAGNIVERNWQPFVRRHLGLPSIPIHELVVQTRRHWLRVFVPGLLAIWVVSVICHFSFPIESGKWLHGGIGASGFLILLWGMLIVATPKTGFRSSRRVEVSNAASAKMAFGFVLYPLALTLLTIFVPQGTTRDDIQVAIGCGVLGIIL